MKKSLYDFCIEKKEFTLLVQWDKEKNGDLTPMDVSYGSTRKVWWHCEAGHQWQSIISSRSGPKSAGCPYCSGRKLDPNGPSLATEHPNLIREWHPTKNGDLSPKDFSPASHRKVWWVCERGHEWDAQIKSRTRGNGCPICANRKVLAGFNDLATTHPKIAAQWHPEKNGILTPHDMVAGNHAKVWWQCERGHEWQTTIVSRTSNQADCPVCAGKVVIPGENDLESQFPKIASQWHPSKNGTKTPDQVTAYSNHRVWWVCEKGHDFRAVIAHRVFNDSGCPYCTNRFVLAGFNDLETTRPKIAAQWHPELNGTLTAQMVTAGSNKKVWWQCPDGHVWKAVIYSRTGKNGSGCPVCAGKGPKTANRTVKYFYSR